MNSTQMNSTHKLKILPQYFQAVWDGQKPFELRKNDRNFQVGDVLFLQEYLAHEQACTGREIICWVTYLLEGFNGLALGWCILGIEVLKRIEREVADE